MERRKFVRNAIAAAALFEILPREAAAYSTEQLRGSLNGDGLADPDRWKEVENEFLLDPDLVFLNTGSLGPTPKTVVQAVNDLGRELEKDPVHGMWGSDLSKQMEAVRTLAANLISAELDEVFLTNNTTEGMNFIASSLDIKPGDEILTTNHEHGGGMVCWQYLAEQKGAKVVYIEMPGVVSNKAQLLQLVEDHITAKTRVCSLMHIDTITGMTYPLADIAKITRPKNILLIADGAQAPGMLDVNVNDLGVDAYCSSSHKWLLAPKGSGIMFIRKEAQERIKPISAYTGYNVYSASIGTRNLPLIIGHGLAIDFHNNIGKKQVENRCKELSNHFRRELEDISNLKLLTPDAPGLTSGMVSYSVKGMEASKLYNRLLSEEKIRVKVAQGTYAYVKDKTQGSYNAIRLSTHIFNNEEQIEKTAKALRRILR